jgi:tetrapyrrole methylase family protein/MazG family protein
MQDDHDFGALVGIMDRLRSSDGCPWDREQDYDSLRGYLLEECYEAVEAIDDEDEDALREELGDLLFQIVFLSRIGKERGRFTVADVIRGITEKMIRRHPHVFGDESVDSSHEVLKNWEAIKREEKRSTGGEAPESVLSGIPTALPALQKAHRLGTKAARVGFDWARDEDLLDKIEEEIAELRHRLRTADRPGVREEYGDLLFALVMLARRLEIDPERSLEQTNRKFRRRFEAVERRAREAGVELHSAGLERLDRLWNEVKAEEARAVDAQDPSTPMRRNRS